MTNSNYKLTKEDFNQINKRSLFTFQLGWNYERMQASGYLYMILPQLRKMYGDGTPELKEMKNVEPLLNDAKSRRPTPFDGFMDTLGPYCP